MNKQEFNRWCATVPMEWNYHKSDGLGIPMYRNDKMTSGTGAEQWNPATDLNNMRLVELRIMAMRDDIRRAWIVSLSNVCGFGTGDDVILEYSGDDASILEDDLISMVVATPANRKAAIEAIIPEIEKAINEQI